MGTQLGFTKSTLEVILEFLPAYLTIKISTGVLPVYSVQRAQYFGDHTCRHHQVN